nr:unnamed protein product [Spirometra erinaceieuropaei]
MSVKFLLVGIFVLLVLSADGRDAYIISHSKAKADQPQNDDFVLKNEKEYGNSKVNNVAEENNEGEGEMLHDVDETGQENVQYHDAEDSSDEEDSDDVHHHGGHDQEDEEEEIDFGDNMDEHHFANSGFEVNVAVHVGGHHGADEHYFGEYDADKDNDDEDDNKGDLDVKSDDDEDQDDRMSEEKKHRLVLTDEEDEDDLK